MYATDIPSRAQQNGRHQAIRTLQLVVLLLFGSAISTAAFAEGAKELVGEGIFIVVGTAIGAVGLAVGYPIYFTYKKIRHASHLYKVWYGTNREYNLLSGAFESKYSTDITYGTCTVSIPKSHKFGSIGSPWYFRVLQRLVAGTDDKLRVVGTERTALGKR